MHIVQSSLHHFAETKLKNNFTLIIIIIIINVAKYNLGKVNLEPMLVSCFPSYIRGGQLPLAGAPCDLYTEWLACSSSQSVVAIACCCVPVCALAFPIPPSPLRYGPR